MDGLENGLARLVGRGVLSAAQADAVLAEVGTAAPAAPAAPVAVGPPMHDVSPVRGVSQAVELAAYLGGVFTLVALGFLVAAPWAHAPRAVRVALLVGLAAVLVGAGAGLRGPDPVRGRLSGTLWATAVVAAATSAVILLDGGDAAPFYVGLAATALAVPLYLVQRHGAQVVALVAAGFVLVAGLAKLATAHVPNSGRQVAVASAVYGLAVVALGVRGVLAPPGPAIALGAAGALVSLQLGSFGGTRALMLGLGVLVCAGLFALATRTGAVLAGITTVGMAVLLPQLVNELGGGGAGVPGLLLVTGLTLLGGAVLTARLRRR
jgi:hypothetical protein